MKVSSDEVLLAAIQHYVTEPHSHMRHYIHAHPGGGTEGVSMILLLREAKKAVIERSFLEQKLRDIGRILYAAPEHGVPL
jgi:hypothetical protein